MATFDFDISDPTDGFIVSQYPADARNFRTIVQTFLDVEHDAPSGTPGGQGRHKFGIGNYAARDAVEAEFEVGGIWFNTERISGEYALDILTNTTGPVWEESGYAFTDFSNEWTALQWTAYYDINAAAGDGDYDTVSTPAEVNLYWSDGNYQTVELSKSATLINGANKPSAGDAAQIVLEVVQDGTGSRTLGYDTEYVFPLGVEPVLSTDPAAVDVLVLTVLSGGGVMVTFMQDVS